MMVALYLRPLLNKGGLAQLVERLHGMQEVIGSNPLSSTRVEGVPRSYAEVRRGTEFFLRVTPYLQLTQ